MTKKTRIIIRTGELENVKYAINGILKEIQSDSIDLGYIKEKLDAIYSTASRVRFAQIHAGHSIDAILKLATSNEQNKRKI